MPYDLEARRPEPPRALRAAVLDLISRKETGGIDDPALRAALRNLLAESRRPVDDLWQRYRGGREDARGRVLARYAD